MSEQSKHQVVGYVRVSSIDQNTERQLDGMEFDKTFTDKASGGSTNRPALQEMLDYVRTGDTIVVHSMDRLARSLVDLLALVETLNKDGVKVKFVKENLEFTGSEDATSTLMLQVMGAVAQFERSMIKSRQAEGIAKAKKRGVYKGRSKALNPDEVEDAKKRIADGESKTAVAKDLEISRQTLYQYLR